MADIDAPVRLFDTLCLGCGVADDVERTQDGNLTTYRCRACGATASATPGDWP
jgi:hypothetical protein